MSNDRRFFFVQCSERSGSNLISRLFDAHREVCGPAPSHLIRTFCDFATRYGDLSQVSAWNQLLEDVEVLFQSMVGHWGAPILATNLRTYTTPGDVAGLFRQIFQEEGDRHQKPHIFLKENHLYRHLPFVLTAFPEARFIYLVRDPRDMALSWKEARELRGDVLRSSAVWTSDQTRGLEVLAQLRANGRMIIIRYEDLVDNTETELRRACAHLGLDFDPSMLQYHEVAGTQQHAAASQSWANVAKPIMQGNHGKWRSKLTPEEITVVEGRCGELMKVFGYTPSLPPIDEISLQTAVQTLAPHERAEKPSYLSVPTREKEKRTQFARLIENLRGRPTKL